MFEMRGGEVALAEDPASQAGDAQVVFIGTLRTSWHSRVDCPKNMREARERGVGATVEIRAQYRQGLAGSWCGEPCRDPDLAASCAAKSDCAEAAPCP